MGCGILLEAPYGKVKCGEYDEGRPMPLCQRCGDSYEKFRESVYKDYKESK